MAAKASWEIDPETRSKLSQIQKKEGAGNDKCCDCGAPSPQWVRFFSFPFLYFGGDEGRGGWVFVCLCVWWHVYGVLWLTRELLYEQASPKFGNFICLTCAGTHRGLGVHVSFVRSISMDAFKSAEIARMDRGGNKRWQEFFTANNPQGATFEECTVKERYDCETGEEWKERLSAEVEGREFDEAEFKARMEEMRRKREEKEREREKAGSKQASRSATPLGGKGVAGRTESPAAAAGRGGKGPGITPEQKAQNEAYFARMGEANAGRPEGLAPSQGGKYGGFGSAPPPAAGGPGNGGEGGMPGADDFQKDPIAALGKGFGWFGGMVSKQAKMVNDSYLQPTAKNVSTAEAMRVGTESLTNCCSSRHRISQHKHEAASQLPARGSRRAPRGPLRASIALSKVRMLVRLRWRSGARVVPRLSRRRRTSGTASVRRRTLVVAALAVAVAVWGRVR